MGSRNGVTMKWVTDREREAMAGLARGSCTLIVFVCLIFFGVQVTVTSGEESSTQSAQDASCRQVACDLTNLCTDDSRQCYKELSRRRNCSKDEQILAKAYYLGYSAIDSFYCYNNTYHADFKSNVDSLRAMGCWEDFSKCIVPHRGVFDGTKLKHDLCDQLWELFLECRTKPIEKKCHESARFLANTLYNEIDCGSSDDREGSANVHRPFISLYVFLTILMPLFVLL